MCAHAGVCHTSMVRCRPIMFTVIIAYAEMWHKITMITIDWEITVLEIEAFVNLFFCSQLILIAVHFGHMFLRLRLCHWNCFFEISRINMTSLNCSSSYAVCESIKEIMTMGKGLISVSVPLLSRFDVGGFKLGKLEMFAIFTKSTIYLLRFVY